MKILKDLKNQIKDLSDFNSTQMINRLLSDIPEFIKISSKELDLLVIRDEEDKNKLRKGIEISLNNHIIDKLENTVEWISISVDGKLPDAICNEVLSKINLKHTGITITICGDSGVGKGTLVSHLEDELENCIKWSNGDIFRLITFLVLEQLCKKTVNETDLNEINFAELVKRVNITAKNEIYIESKGEKLYLENIKNGLLKEDAININLPTVAKHTQGEVILITNKYISNNKESIILAEGRKETLDYVQSDYKFEIIMINKSQLGERRASQKILQMIQNYTDDSIEIDRFLKENYR